MKPESFSESKGGIVADLISDNRYLIKLRKNWERRYNGWKTVPLRVSPLSDRRWVERVWEGLLVAIEEYKRNLEEMKDKAAKLDENMKGGRSPPSHPHLQDRLRQLADLMCEELARRLSLHIRDPSVPPPADRHSLH